MAIAFVRRNVDFVGPASDVSSRSVTVPFSTNSTPGNSLVAFISLHGTDVYVNGVTDNHSNSWLNPIFQQSTDDDIEVWCANASLSTSSITILFAGGSSTPTDFPVRVLEFSVADFSFAQTEVGGSGTGIA